MIIPNRERRLAKSGWWRLWDYIAVTVKRLSALLRKIASKHYSDYYCLNCLYSFRTTSTLGSYKKLCGNKDFCNVIMASEDTKILEFNQYQKSD